MVIRGVRIVDALGWLRMFIVMRDVGASGFLDAWIICVTPVYCIRWLSVNCVLEIAIVIGEA